MLTIHTGFLSGNLFADCGYDEEASAVNYAAELETALQEEFPNAKIEVVWQAASGCLPYDCETRVDAEDEDEEEDDYVARVDQIAERVYSSFSWAVEEEEEEEEEAGE